MLVNVALGAAKCVEQHAVADPKIPVSVLPDPPTIRIQLSLEGGSLTIENRYNSGEDRPHTVVAALASLALDGPHYNVIQNTFSKRLTGTRLASHLFHASDTHDTAELCRERRSGQVITGFRLHGIMLHQKNVLHTPVAPSSSDNTYRINLLPSEKYIRPLNRYRIVAHRLQSTIDLMVLFAAASKAAR